MPIEGKQKALALAAHLAVPHFAAPQQGLRSALREGLDQRWFAPREQYRAYRRAAPGDARLFPERALGDVLRDEPD